MKLEIKYLNNSIVIGEVGKNNIILFNKADDIITALKNTINFRDNTIEIISQAIKDIRDSFSEYIHNEVIDIEKIKKAFEKFHNTNTLNPIAYINNIGIMLSEIGILNSIAVYQLYHIVYNNRYNEIKAGYIVEGKIGELKKLVAVDNTEYTYKSLEVIEETSETANNKIINAVGDIKIVESIDSINNIKCKTHEIKDIDKEYKDKGIYYKIELPMGLISKKLIHNSLNKEEEKKAFIKSADTAFELQLAYCAKLVLQLGKELGIA